MKEKVCLPITHLSRTEVMTLLYNKLNTIREEADTLCDPDALKPTDLKHAMERLKRIAIEARRAASLIDTYEVCSKAGHCSHCGKTYEEHDEQRSDAARAKVQSKNDPHCMALSGSSTQSKSRLTKACRSWRLHYEGRG